MNLHGARQGCRQGIPWLIGGKLDSGRVFGFLLLAQFETEIIFEWSHGK